MDCTSTASDGGVPWDGGLRMSSAPSLCLYYLLDREEALREKNSDPEKWNKNRDRDGKIMEEEET